MGKDTDKRVLVAMSGGMDSSASCLLLQQEGYEVEGITFRLWEENNDENVSIQSLSRAQEAAQRLGIPHHIVDLRSAFRQEVVDYFCSCYLQGKTPNPCVRCNWKIKWPYLLQYANALNCHWIATGHYAQILQEDGKCFIGKGVDSLKDQSYFLWSLREELHRTLFPLGGVKKEEVKELLKKHDFFPISGIKESMDICFIKDDYRQFLRTQIPDLDRKIGEGNFVDFTKKILGKHQGYPFYTIGQRRKLGIALGVPAFVTRIFPQTNEVELGTEKQLFSQTMRVKDGCVHSLALFESDEVNVKIRYRSKEVPCKVIQEGEEMRVDFKEPVSAVTSGQSAVFYIKEKVVGGGIIV